MAFKGPAEEEEEVEGAAALAIWFLDRPSCRLFLLLRLQLFFYSSSHPYWFRHASSFAA